MPAKSFRPFFCLLVFICFIAAGVRASGQSKSGQSINTADPPDARLAAPIASVGEGASLDSGNGAATSSSGNGALPTAGADEPWNVAPAGTMHQAAFSRVGIGANVSPLGIGINGATVLSDDFDVRLMGNFFGYTSPTFDVEGFRANMHLHLSSLASSLDWYPYNSVFRLSPGMMFYNGNQISGSTVVASGTDFSVNGQTYYSASPNAVTGAAPLGISAVIGLHPRPVAFTLAGGFGRFVPHSQRHWSFPSEFGVVFMGAPTLNVATSGWVCLDKAQTQCSDINSTASPVAQQFNSALQAQLTKWRKDLGVVQIYPMFSYSVVYSFDLP